jgi:hypothetical protein
MTVLNKFNKIFNIPTFMDTGFFVILLTTASVIKYQVVKQGPAIAQAVSSWLPTTAAPVRSRLGHVGFVVDKLKMGQVCSEYFGFPCQSSIYQILHPHNHPRHVK